jgi:hypothetical protein
VLGDTGREVDALLFVSPILRGGDDPRAPDLPAGLQGRLSGIALEAPFAELILAPCWISTAALLRLKPSELREAAEALANGLEPPIPRAAPTERVVCLLGLALPMAFRLFDDEAAEAAADDRLEAWLAAVAEAAGGGRAEPPLTLGRALDLVRRVKLAIPDELVGGAEDEADDEDIEISEELVEALIGHLREVGEGSALLSVDGVVAIRIADGTPDIAPDALAQRLGEALLGGGIMFVVPAAPHGAASRGYAYLLESGEAVGLSAADAAAAFEDDGSEDWTAIPASWVDAPALDYDPAIP